MDKKITVAVSGDPGFYSILGFLKKHFEKEELAVYPGISSFQYMFCKLGLSWENYFLASVHGREMDVLKIVKENKKTFFLTDKNFSYKEISKILTDNGFGNADIIIGNNLSYPDETIVMDKAEILKDKDFDFKLSVTAVSYE